MRQVSINDIVEVIETDGAEKTGKNRVGVVVSVFDGDQKYYDIEISDPDGRTVEVLTIPITSIRLI